MGTRNLTMVKLNGKIRVAQYGQWDGYPTGQGETVAQFVQTWLVGADAEQTDARIEMFADKVRRLRWVTDDETTQIEAMSYAIFPAQFSRDTGAHILTLIAVAHVEALTDNASFLKDTLFCEWAYCVNLDKRVVEVYQSTTRPVARIPFADFTPASMESLEEKLRTRRAKKVTNAAA